MMRVVVRELSHPLWHDAVAVAAMFAVMFLGYCIGTLIRAWWRNRNPESRISESDYWEWR